MSEQKEKLDFSKIFKSIIYIFLLSFSAYAIMVFISHFSVNHQLDGYSYFDSIKAIYSKSLIAKEFILGFGLITFSVVIFALIIKFFVSLIKK